MPVHEFVALPRLRPHQELLAQKKLVRWDSSMQNVFFLSHQWTSFREPDHSLQQLRTFQQLLTRMTSGKCPDTAPKFTNTQDHKITSAGWQEIASSAFIWMDFISVPQVGTYHDPDAAAELMKAVLSIPAFVERSTHFFVFRLFFKFFQSFSKFGSRVQRRAEIY